MMSFSDRVALLAPVPEMHLESVDETRMPFIAFGAGALDRSSTGPLRLREEFQQFDEDVNYANVTLLLYPSMDEVHPKPLFRATWAGIYIGHEDADGAGLYPSTDPWESRPATCKENYEYDPAKERFALYWKVQGLIRLPERLQLDIEELDRTQLFNHARPPHRWPLGPERLDGRAWWGIRDFVRSTYSEL